MARGGAYGQHRKCRRVYTFVRCFASIEAVADQILLNINFTASGNAEARCGLGRVSEVPAATV